MQLLCLDADSRGHLVHGGLLVDALSHDQRSFGLRGLDSARAMFDMFDMFAW